ncbi:hypothetical protein AmDm5_1573 [Acetobacter malorum]|nr:hypothetical protein AmDm5_1573 [Acetobacter malorum]
MKVSIKMHILLDQHFFMCFFEPRNTSNFFYVKQGWFGIVVL